METELQANVLSADTVKKAMPSCLVYALVQSMTFMVDTIVAGHFLGTDAVAAIAPGMRFPFPACHSHLRISGRPDDMQCGVYSGVTGTPSLIDEYAINGI